MQSKLQKKIGAHFDPVKAERRRRLPPRVGLPSCLVNDGWWLLSLPLQFSRINQPDQPKKDAPNVQRSP